jgi:hypothetical protein
MIRRIFLPLLTSALQGDEDNTIVAGMRIHTFGKMRRSVGCLIIIAQNVAVAT